MVLDIYFCHRNENSVSHHPHLFFFSPHHKCKFIISDESFIGPLSKVQTMSTGNWESITYKQCSPFNAHKENLPC